MSKTIETIISEKGYTVTRPKGTSMFPLLRGKVDVCIVKPDFPLQIYDIPVYKRMNGEYVMHRILGIDDNGYICCGDNQWSLEYGIKESRIVGVLEEWYYKDKKHTVNDKRYLRYVKFWCKSLNRRRILLFFCHKYIYFKGVLKEIERKILGK